MTAPFETAPFDLATVLEPTWLSEALRARYPGCRVREVEEVDTSTRVSTNSRIRVHYEPSRDPLPPRELCIKGYFDEVNRPFGVLARPETRFYAEYADKTPLRTLEPSYASYDPAAAHGILITRDLTGDGAVFLDSLSPYTLDQAALSLEQYARLHATWWAHPGVLASPDIAARQSLYLGTRTVDDIASNYEGPIGAGMPADLRDPERLRMAYGALARMVEQDIAARDLTLVHGDAHIGNIFLDSRGRPSLVDWQLTQPGPWFLDVGYHIASALTVEDRRAHEDDLLRHYLDVLVRTGGPVLDFGEARDRLRFGVLSGLYLWSITLKVAPAVTTTLLARLGTAAADHDALRVGPV